MVFQDYELIPTKRVNKYRLAYPVYWKRLFHAMGAYNTLFLGSLTAYGAFLTAYPLGHLPPS